MVRIGYVAELKHQLAEKDKEIQEWKDGTMIVKYEKQLAEKDKEIKCIKMLLEAYRSQCHEFLKNETQFHNQIRHQICEKIKRILYDNWKEMKLWWLSNGKCKELEEILDQIEKGE